MRSPIRHTRVTGHAPAVAPADLVDQLVGCQQVPLTPIEPATPQRAAHVWLRVADSGPGVPAPLADRIFTPFFTTKPVGQGTGLGSFDLLRRALAAVPGGVGNPGGGLAVLAVSLLGAIVVDLVLWQEREAACASSQGAHA